ALGEIVGMAEAAQRGLKPVIHFSLAGIPGAWLPLAEQQRDAEQAGQMRSDRPRPRGLAGPPGRPGGNSMEERAGEASAWARVEERERLAQSSAGTALGQVSDSDLTPHADEGPRGAPERRAGGRWVGPPQHYNRCIS